MYLCTVKLNCVSAGTVLITFEENNLQHINTITYLQYIYIGGSFKKYKNTEQTH